MQTVSASQLAAPKALSIDRSSLSVAWRYALAVVFVALVFFASLALRRFFSHPFLFLFLASVMASAWYGGIGPGLLAVLLSTLLADYYFVTPFHSFSIGPKEVAYFAGFVICVLIASWVSALKRQSEEALKEARAQLEARVAQRTLELQASNARLTESERELRLLTEVIPQQIWAGTPGGNVDYCNQRLLDYVGLTRETMSGPRLFETIHPEDRESFQQALQIALTSGEPFEGEWRVRGCDGNYRSFFTRAVALRNPEGKIVRWYGTSTDVEESRRVDRALLRTQAELTHLSRVLSMGELTSSIAHEIDQPITAVVTNGHACLEWLSAQPPDLMEVRQAAQRIVRDGTRAGAILARIRAMFSREVPASDQVHVNEVIRELVVILHAEAASRNVTLQTELSSNLAVVEGDRVQMQQVLLNLVLNGMDAMEGATGRPRELVIRSVRKDPASILIQVEDTGPGLSSKLTEQIFAPFFTTKPGGIGMGLSISRSIVEAHGGRLWAAPRAGGGAIFQFTIPTGSRRNDD